MWGASRLTRCSDPVCLLRLCAGKNERGGRKKKKKNTTPQLCSESSSTTETSRNTQTSHWNNMTCNVLIFRTSTRGGAYFGGRAATLKQKQSKTSHWEEVKSHKPSRDFVLFFPPSCSTVSLSASRARSPNIKEAHGLGTRRLLPIGESAASPLAESRSLAFPLPRSDWPKLGHSLRPEVSPCYCRVTDRLKGEEGGEGRGRRGDYCVD